MKRIIAHEYLKELLFHEMSIASENTEGLEIVSLGRMLNDSEQVSDGVLILQLAKILKERKDEFPDYSKMFLFPSFYEEIITFARKLVLFGIDASQLPSGDSFEVQLKNIVAAALTLPLHEKKTSARLESSLQEISSTCVICPSYEADYFTYSVIERLKEMQAEVMELLSAKPRSILRRHALSLRMEIEGCAQYICRSGQPCNIILCSPSSQLPVLEQVFARYDIPFSYTVKNSNPRFPSAYRTLCEFAFCPDSEHLIAALDAQAFDVVFPDRLVDFLNQVLTKAEAPCNADKLKEILGRAASGKSDPDKKSGRDIVSLYTEAENDAKKYFARIQKTVDLLSEPASPKEKMIRAYNAMTSCPLLKGQGEAEAGRGILKTLQECLDEIETSEDALMLAKIIENSSGSDSALVTDFCMVTDLHHPVPAKTNTFVLGCTSSDYPGFTAMQGLFDEQYVSQVSGFPTLGERQDACISQLEWISRSCTDTLIWSWPTNDYQGRARQPAVEIEKIRPDERWQVERYDLHARRTHLLTKETARELFAKEEDGEQYVSGSISSVENWFACPYRRFLSSGLYGRKENPLILSADQVGTWQHLVMENAVYNADGTTDKDYAEKLDEEKISTLLSPYFEALHIMNPNDSERIRLSQERMTESLKKAADFLRSYERSTTFIPEKTEMNFYHYPISPHVRLNGTADRINVDHRNHLLEVIDYKSSTRKLSEKNVASGNQLQLLSYLMAAVDLMEYETEPAGSYYFSLNRENSDSKDTTAMKVTRNNWKLTENDYRADDEGAAELMLKNRQMNGWTFTDRADAVDSEGKHIAGLSKKYDFEAVRECLETVYEYFYSQLLGLNEEGQPVIAAAPLAGACQWCDYRCICRFHGDDRTAEVIYPGKFSAGKEKKNAD